MFPTTIGVDMFPTTYVSNSIATTHVETVALLRRKDVYQRIKYDVNLEEN